MKLKPNRDYLKLSNCVIVPREDGIWIQTISESILITLEELKKTVKFIEQRKNNG